MRHSNGFEGRTIKCKIGITDRANIGWSSRGGPGRAKRCGEEMCELIFAFKYNPDALPFWFGRICAPAGTSAGRAIHEDHLIPRVGSHCRSEASSCGC